MYHVYSLLVKPKYTVNDVKKINQLCHKYIPGKFIHYCLTDDTDQFGDQNFCNLIDVKEYDLEIWWYKLLLFKKGMCPTDSTCLFFDLDSTIINSLAPILSNYNGKLTIATNPHKINSMFVNQIMYHQFGDLYTMMNSSFMMWKGDANCDLWEKFASDINYYVCKYGFGNDQFMTFEYDNFHLLDEKYVTDYQLKRLNRQRPEAVISLKG